MWKITVWSKNFHILTRSWMRDWTWTNDNNKHKHKNSDSVNFSMITKRRYGICNHIPCIIYSNYSKLNQFGTFPLWWVILFKVWWFSPLHRRCTIEYQYSCQYSYEYLSTCPRVQLRVLWLWNSRVQYEYKKFSTRVLRVRVLSTSTPALRILINCLFWPKFSVSGL